MATDPMWCFENYGSAAEWIDELKAENAALKAYEAAVVAYIADSGNAALGLEILTDKFALTRQFRSVCKVKLSLQAENAALKEQLEHELNNRDNLREQLAAAQKDADSFSALVQEARQEADKAMRKFPQPNYVISKIAEESGEVVKAAIHFAEGREEAINVRLEMKQAIAMLYRLWIEGDQIHGCPAIDAAIEKEKS